MQIRDEKMTLDGSFFRLPSSAARQHLLCNISHTALIISVLLEVFQVCRKVEKEGSAMDLANTINNITRRVPAWPVYILLFIPLGLYTYWMLTGGLGADPVRVFEHAVGELALQFLILGLAITPLHELTKINLIKYRRAIGLMAFYYTFAHLSVYVVFDQSLDMGEIWRDIVKRPYITFGMVAFVLMVPLALTSNNPAIRKIGPVVWRKIHKLVYIIVIGAVLHFMLLTKTWEVEPMIYAGILAVLLGYRYRESRKSARAARLKA